MQNLLFIASADSTVCRIARNQILPIFQEHYVVHHSFDSYTVYSVAIFFGPQSFAVDLRKTSPDCYIINLDPKLNCQSDYDEVIHSDLALVSSVEQQIFAERYCSNVHIFNWFPSLSCIPSSKLADSPVVIAYQGNKVHLNSMAHSVSPALSRLYREGYDIRLLAIYDIMNLGFWTYGRPSLPIDDLQWEDSTYLDHLASAQIGIIPNLLPVGSRRAHFLTWTTALGSRLHNYNPNDYILRFKLNSNANRFWEFSQLDIPIVADMYPSSSQLVSHGLNGFLACNAQDWYYSLKRLITSPELRIKFSLHMRQTMEEFSPASNVHRLISILPDELFISN